MSVSAVLARGLADGVVWAREYREMVNRQAGADTLRQVFSAAR